MTKLADRYNGGKPQWSLVDFDALLPLVQVLEFGAKKYSKHNWKKGLPYTQIVDSMQRHITAILKGEDIDPESNLPHIGHVLCNAMFLSYMQQYRTDLDDRIIDVNKLDSVTKTTINNARNKVKR